MIKKMAEKVGLLNNEAFEHKCQYCGETYLNTLFFKFSVVSPDNTSETEEACADCIGSWFTETPEDVKTMMIWRA